MKILMAHNEYQLAGGEDTVYRAEVELLRSRGHEVVQYVKSNADLDSMGRLEQLKTTIWNSRTISELSAILELEKCDVAHFHNTLAVISPSAYLACRRQGVPVVQTLHNYRQLCPNALFYRDGHACEDCLGKAFPAPGVLHACYRGSRSASLGIALMLVRNRGVMRSMVDRFICLTDFARQKHIAGGLPAEKIVVRPNFLATDPGVGSGGDHALFVGRLSEEKGPDILLRAWLEAGLRRPLKIVGDGPLLEKLKETAKSHAGIQFLGRKSPDEVRELQKMAAVTLITSRVYEGLPMALVESFACGSPVIAPHHAAMPELVSDGGWTYVPEDVRELANLVTGLDEGSLQRARPRARALFEQHYTAERSYESLMDIYRSVSKG